MTSPTKNDDLRQLILDALATDYISQSCHDAIETGNHYQSVRLGDMWTSGFRTDREQVLQSLAFTGRKVLDLGSNLGELSRASRAQGAALVDGFEYDLFFIETANMINALNGTTRVSFYQRDISDPAVYSEEYDIVLCFSVFVYISKIIRELAAITYQGLVLETHRLDERGDALYIDALQEYFPAHQKIGTTEWGTPHGEEDKRSVLAFARTEAALSNVLSMDQG